MTKSLLGWLAVRSRGGITNFFGRKKFPSVFLSLILSVLFSTLTIALIPTSASGAEGTIAATVNIKTPLIITCETDLDFGKICPGRTNGTVVVTTDDNRYATGGAQIKGYKFHRAEFGIAGNPGCFYDIIVTAGYAFLDNDHDGHDDDCGCNSDDDDDEHNGEHNGNRRGDDKGKRGGKYDGKHDNDGNDCDSDHDGDHDRDDHNVNSHGSHSSASSASLQVIHLISYSTTVGANTNTGRINSSGTDQVFVGGTLVVPTTAIGGSYSCNIELTVNY